MNHKVELQGEKLRFCVLFSLKVEELLAEGGRQESHAQAARYKDLLDRLGQLHPALAMDELHLLQKTNAPDYLVTREVHNRAYEAVAFEMGDTPFKALGRPIAPPVISMAMV